jgi:hypothetical protein
MINVITRALPLHRPQHAAPFETAKLNDTDPQAWLTNVLSRIAERMLHTSSIRLQVSRQSFEEPCGEQIC